MRTMRLLVTLGDRYSVDGMAGLNCLSLPALQSEQADVSSRS